MKSLLLGCAIMCVLALAAWAYRENYATLAELDRVDKLNQDIVTAKARLRVLNAEWAYLNRPERLSELARMNFEKLQLLHLSPHHFAFVDQIPYTGQAAPVDVQFDGDTPE